MTAWERLDQWMNRLEERGQELLCTLTSETYCCWSCELKFIARPNVDNDVDESVAFFATGDGYPEPIVVLARVIEAFEAWARAHPGIVIDWLS